MNTPPEVYQFQFIAIVVACLAILTVIAIAWKQKKTTGRSPIEIIPYPPGATPKQMTVSWVYLFVFLLFFNSRVFIDVRWLTPVAALILPGVGIAMTAAYIVYAFRVLLWSFSDRWELRMVPQQAFHLLLGMLIAWLTYHDILDLLSSINKVLFWTVAIVESSILIPFLLRYLVYREEGQAE